MSADSTYDPYEQPMRLQKMPNLDGGNGHQRVEHPEQAKRVVVGDGAPSRLAPNGKTPKRYQRRDGLCYCYQESRRAQCRRPATERVLFRFKLGTWKNRDVEEYATFDVCGNCCVTLMKLDGFVSREPIPEESQPEPPRPPASKPKRRHHKRRK